MKSANDGDLDLSPSRSAVERANRLHLRKAAEVVKAIKVRGFKLVRQEDGTKRQVPAKASPGRPVAVPQRQVSAAVPPATNVRPWFGVVNPGTNYWGVEWDVASAVSGGRVEVYRDYQDRDDVLVAWEEDTEPAGYVLTGGRWLLAERGDYYAIIKTRDDNGNWSSPVRSETWSSLWSDPLPDWMAWGTCTCETSSGFLSFLVRMVADPVNTATGNFTETVSDASMRAPGVSFDLSRTYNSADSSTGLLGKGWSFQYEVSLKIEAGKVAYRAEDGQRVVFVKQADGTYAARGARSRLTAITGGFALTTRDYQRLEFDEQGRLMSWKDAAGQGLTFSYGAGLSKITDAAGREIAVELQNQKVTKLTLPDGRFVSYTYEGDLLKSVRDLRGGVTTYGHDASGRVTTVTDQKNRLVTQNTYGGGGRVIEQIDQTGGKWGFAYQPDAEFPWIVTTTVTDPRNYKHTYVYSGNVLVKEIGPLAHTTSYSYDTSLRRTSMLNPRGDWWLWKYDDLDRVTQKTDPANQKEIWTYHSTTDDVKTHTDVRGKVTEYTYSTAHLPETIKETGTDGKTRTKTMAYNSRGLLESETSFADRTTTYSYDAQGNPATRTTEEGNTTSYTHDASGRRETQTDPRGAATSEAGDFTTTFGYDAADHLTSARDARDHTTLYRFDEVGDMVEESDPFGKTMVWTYDNAHRKKSKQRQGWAGQEKWQYDLTGNLVKHTEPTGGVETYGWDAANFQISMYTARGNVSGIPPEEKAKFRWEFDNDANGNRIATRTPPTVQPDGTVKVNQTTTAFDKLNRPTVVTDPRGHKTATGYDAVGNITSVTNHMGHKTIYGYDSLGRRVSETSPRGTATATPTDDYQTDYGFDADDNLISETSPLGNKTTWSFDQDGRQSSMVDARGHVTGADPAAFTWTYEYDGAGNQTSVKDPLGHVTTTEFDPANNLSLRRDANQHTTTYSYDDKDRLAKAVAPDEAETVYGYDGLDNLVSVKNPRGNTATYGYDAMGRIIETVDPLGRKVTHKYDPEGNLAQTVTARGNTFGADPVPWTIGYSYDARGLRTAVTSPDPQVASTSVYDGAGRLFTATGAGGALTYTYDDADRPLSLTRGTAATSWTYDADGNVTSRTYPDERKITASFDEDQRQVTSYLDSTSKMTFSYFANDAIRGIFYPASSTRNESYNYDNAGRLSKIFSGPEATALSKFEVTRDPVGNPAKIVKTGSSGARTETFSYDEQDRISRVCYDINPCGDTSTKSIGYGYDKAGNRTSQTRTGMTNPGATSYEYDVADQLTKTSTGGVDTAYTYDGDGNLASTGSVTYAHDVLNRMRKTVDGTISTTINYDAESRRLSMQRTGESNRNYYWDTNYQDGLPRIGLQSIGYDRITMRYTDTGIPLQVAYGTYATAESPMKGALGDRSPPSSLKAGLDVGKSPYDADIVGAIDAASTLLDTAWLYHDPIGSIVDVTDGAEGSDTTTAGTPEWHTDYDPYGIPDSKKLTTGAREPFYGFTGEYSDPTGDLYLRARQYQPQLGRFTATDPVARDIEDPYVATYVYAANQPGVLTDPSGENNQCGPTACGGGGLSSGGVPTAGFNPYGVNLGGGFDVWSEVTVFGGLPWYMGVFSQASINSLIDSCADSMARKIANGHAFDKHVISRWPEFRGIRTRGELAEVAKGIIVKGQSKQMVQNGVKVTAYWHKGVIVIWNPMDPDGGTIFVPRGGKAYFDNL